MLDLDLDLELELELRLAGRRLARPWASHGGEACPSHKCLLTSACGLAAFV